MSVRMRRRLCVVLGIVSVVLLAECLRAQALGDLEALARVRPGRPFRATSTNPVDPSNRDNVWVKPGDTHVLLDIAGPGVVRHIWLTFAEAAPNWLAKEGAADPQEIVLRMYWEGAETPAVEAPLGDFFAAGFGKRAAVRSLPVQVEGGDAYNCFWSMPFTKHAKVTLTNESSKPLAALYYQIDGTLEPVPDDAAHFCAQYRQEYPTELGKDYLILDALGRGHFVGCVLSVRSRSPEWFGEGDDKFTIDGEEKPSLRGTGTEDYFLNAWGLEKATYPYFGVPILEGGWGEVGQRFCAYRWHIADPVRFEKSLKVEIEHFGWMSADETKSGRVEGFVEREDDFATVAFWYQLGQPKRFAPLPSAAARRLPEIDRIVEGKTLLLAAAAENGAASLQAGGPWTGEGQLFFDGREVGASLTTRFEIAEKSYRRLIVSLTHSYDFGVYDLYFDGEKLGDSRDLYSAEVAVREHHLGDRALEPGPHVLKLVCVAKNPLSKGFRAGLDSIRLRSRSTRKR